MVVGIVAGLSLPAVDKALAIDLPALSFDDQSAARSLLETIATATVSVAGLSFSVTVVAFTLASSQLSPRVLRSFRGDRISQMTLALLLGTFIYCLTLLVRLGVSGVNAEPPNLSVTVAVLLALASFATFAGFIAHIVSMLQPSSVIASIHGDAFGVIFHRYPAGPGTPGDGRQAAERAERVTSEREPRVVEADRQGYLTFVNAEPIIAAAAGADALVRQRVEIGSYVLPGQVIADVWSDEANEDIEDKVRSSFSLQQQRTMVQDIAFPVRQLADIALKGLSPGINDPTTAENAVEAMSALLVELARSEMPSAVRVDSEGEPRFVALAPDLDDLVRLGFDQVRVFSGPYPVVSSRLLELLAEVERAAHKEGVRCDEIERQRTLIAAGAGADGPSEADLEAVRNQADEDA